MHNSIVSTRGLGVRVIASASTWIEGEALRQLDEVAKYPGMRRCVGMPDLHPGKGSPVGAAFLSDLIYPALVGSDIGCGMAVWATELSVRKARADKLAQRLDGLDRPWDGCGADWLAAYGVAPTAHDGALGTPGWGNHFLELQRPHHVVDAAAFAALGLEPDRLVALIHTGSRGLGEAVLRDHAARHGGIGLAGGSDPAIHYLAAHDAAMGWAVANRALCASRLLEALRTDGRRVLDVCHNSVTAMQEDGATAWLHRKGAATASAGPVMIPGSRGDLSFLVQAVPGRMDALCSVAHGAGRKLARHEARGKLKDRYRRADLERTPWGGRVVCGDELLLWEEAPDCYKDAATVVEDLVTAGLVTVIASFAPLVTFKTSPSTGEERGGNGEWRRDRRQARQAKWGDR